MQEFPTKKMKVHSAEITDDQTKPKEENAATQLLL